MKMHHSRIRVVHYCNQLSIGGTERTMELFCKYLDRERFDVFAVSKRSKQKLFNRMKMGVAALFGSASARGKQRLWQSMNAREPNFIRLLGADRVLFADNDGELRRLLASLKPDILHVHYSGNPEPPTSDEEVLSQIPVTVTTNQFERENTSPAHRRVKRMLFVSRWLLDNKAFWAKDDPRAEVLYNPVEMPCSDEDLRREFGIPADAFVIGRVGRADSGIHDPISLQAYSNIEDKTTYFLALSPPENMLRQAKALSLSNFIAVKPSADPVFLSKFYNTIDVLAHARRDGETFGCNIAEAMIHGRPVVSHLSPFMNAQCEVIGDSGFICEQGDWKTYADKLLALKSDPQLRSTLSARAKQRALEHFEARKLTKRLEEAYASLLSD